MRIPLAWPCVPLLAVFIAAAAASSAQTAATVIIQVHAGQPTGPYKPIWNFFGADEPNYLYAPNGKKLLGELARLSPVPVRPFQPAWERAEQPAC